MSETTTVNLPKRLSRDAIYCLMRDRVKRIVEEVTRHMNSPDAEQAVNKLIWGADELRDIRAAYADLEESE